MDLNHQLVAIKACTSACPPGVRAYPSVYWIASIIIYYAPK